MNEFQGKVAVITGAASGIGRAIADRCAKEGIKIVLADVEREPLERAAIELEDLGAAVLAVRTDVSDHDQIDALLQATLHKFGSVHLLFNNAGVVVGGALWEQSLEDWQWILGVNLWGVIHGIRAFVPIMLKQDTECHIVNTASGAGLRSAPGVGSYKVTKHGVVSMSETLYHELSGINSKIRVSVLCPGATDTNIMTGARNRSEELQNQPSQDSLGPWHQSQWERLGSALDSGMPAGEVADEVFKAIMNESFYIVTPPSGLEAVRLRMNEILEQRNPESRLNS